MPADSYRSPLVIALFLLAAAGLGLSWWENREIARLKTVLASGDDGLAAMRAMAAKGHGVASAARAPVMTAKAGSPEPTNPAGPVALPRVPNPIDKPPEWQRMAVLQAKQRVDQTYGAFFRQLNLSPDKLEDLKRAVIDKTSAGTDVLAAMQGTGPLDAVDVDDFRAALKVAAAGADSEIQAILGPDAFAAFQNYQATVPQRTLVQSMMGSLISADSALTGTQVEQLVQAIPLSHTGPTGENNPEGMALITDAVIAQAQGFLSPQQLQVLKAEQQLQQATMAADAAARQAAQAKPKG